MNRSHRLAAIGLALSLSLTACGGGDDDATATTATAPASTGDEVDPTISPDLPEAFLAGVGPLGVIGDPLPELPEDGDDPAVGMLAPVLVGENFDGDPVRVNPAADGPTWVVFLAHWCPHCNDEIPVINELRDSGRIPDGIDVVGVSTAANPDRPNYPPGQWLADKDWTFTAIADGVDTDVGTFIGASAYGVTGFPFSVLIGADGTVKARWSGERDPDDLVSLLTNNLALA